ncbi:alkylmercury lyase [Arthrobacter sp. Br18]|uniref:alkylmercury lyase n=1 Tax=Arthrobacter sp. Br18 TaxID=1312954 RepID=UPI00047C98C3|nr:alkylmercury lyase [Arthrobacter sp. Br18]
MKITLQYFDDCPNWTLAHERLVALAEERTDIVLSLQKIETADDAERAGFHGSPSIRINDIDVFAAPGAPVGLACRRYLTPDGPAGAPTIDQLRAALPPATATTTTPLSDQKEI